MRVDLFLDAICHDLAFLFDPYGFEIVRVETRPPHPDYLMVGLESPDCRIAIDQEWGAVTAMIGARTAAFEDAFGQGSIDQWFNVERLADLVEQRPFRWPAPHETVPPETMLAYLADRLQPVAEQLFALIRDEPLDRLAARYKAYAREQIAQRHGGRAE